MSTTPATPGPYSGTSLPATTPAAEPPDKRLPPMDEASPEGHCAVDAACVHRKLDEIGIPRERHGKVLSLWGRVEEYAKKANEITSPEAKAANAKAFEEFQAEIEAVWEPKPAHGSQAATFEAHGKVWTRHTPGDPCPCDPEAKVQCLTSRAGPTDILTAAHVGWKAQEQDGNYWGAIIGWRVDDPAPAAPTEAAEDIKRQRDSLLASLEADKEWIMKAHSMLDDRRWAGKSEMEALVTELEEAWAEIHELALPTQPTEAEPWTPKPGDVVRLKSGGPEMTVEWFDPQRKEVYIVMSCDVGVERGCLSLTSLQPAKEEARP